MPELLAPLMRPWAQRCIASGGPPRPPSGDPIVHVDGADPDRVLLVGSGPAAGAGSADHSAALPGTLARALAARTARGAVVESRGAHQALLGDVRGLIAGARLQRFDALVVFIGLEDGTTGASLARWRHDLAALVEDLRPDGASDAIVVLARIPPASSVGIYRGQLVGLADRRIMRMNRIVDRLAERHEHVVVIATPIPDREAPAGSPAWLARCGDALAAVLHPRFAEARR